MQSTTSLSQSLERVLKSHGEEETGITLGHIATEVGDKGFGLILIVLALPSALPVPAAGYSTPFGILLTVLGIQMILGRPSPWLPKRAREMELSRSLCDTMGSAAIGFFDRVEHLIKPRMSWINGRFGMPLMGILVVVMAALMILPIPLTNTAPAMVVFLIGVGLSEDDGLSAGLACIVGVIAVLLYAYVIYLFLTVGLEGIQQLKEMLKRMLRF